MKSIGGGRRKNDKKDIFIDNIINSLFVGTKQKRCAVSKYEMRIAQML